MYAQICASCYEPGIGISSHNTVVLLCQMSALEEVAVQATSIAGKNRRAWHRNQSL
jgi:hypothetical protein